MVQLRPLADLSAPPAPMDRAARPAPGSRLRNLGSHLMSRLPSPAADPTGSPPPAAAAPSAAAAEGGYTGVVHSFYGSVLDRATMGRCQAILQLSFNRDPDRRGYYIPLDPSELLAGEEREAKIDELFATAKRRGERWHLAYDADGARAPSTPRPTYHPRICPAPDESVESGADRIRRRGGGGAGDDVPPHDAAGRREPPPDPRAGRGRDPPRLPRPTPRRRRCRG